MDEKKLNYLVNTLLKMGEEQERPDKYSKVITELFVAEEIQNVTMIMHKGSPVINYVNKEGGITTLAAEI